MDYIEVVDQKIFAYHGVLEEEKAAGQDFFVSFKAYLDMAPSAAEDRMDLSVSYADMCQTVKETVQGEVYDLIETVADRTASALLKTYPLLTKVVLTVKKPSAPVGEPVAYPAVTVTRSRHKAYVAMGSNMGDSKANIEGAIRQLDDHLKCQVSKRAAIIETEPWGKEDQARFLNTVIELETFLSPKALMTLLLSVEKDYGRVREEKWGPRTLDLDLIFYDSLVTEDPFVTLPHPLMTERAFVLVPLAEIAPQALHPLKKMRVSELLAALKEN